MFIGTPTLAASDPRVSPSDFNIFVKSISNRVINADGVRLVSSKFKDFIDDWALVLSGVKSGIISY